MPAELNKLTDYLLDAGPGILKSIHSPQPGISDLFCESSHVNQINLVARGNHGFRPTWSNAEHSEQGIALRTWREDKECMVTASGFTPTAFDQCRSDLGPGSFSGSALNASLVHEPGAEQPDAPEGVADTEKRMLIQEAVDAAFSMHEAVHQVKVHYRDSTWHRFIMDNRCRLIRKNTHLIEFRIEATLANGASGTAQIASPHGMGYFFNSPLPLLSKKAVASALEKTEGRRLNAGLYPVIIPAGWGGLLLHEAIGHALEADVATGNWASGSYQMGRQIGPSFLCIADNPTVPDGRASYSFDDEGTPASETVLVEHGIMKGLLTDRARSHQVKLPLSGNGRRMNYRVPPLPRMSNLLASFHGMDEYSEPADYPSALQVTNLANGYVTESGTQFVLFVREALLLKHGVPQFPIENLTISAPIEGFLHNIQAMKGTPILDNSRGFCVKQGQTLPVSVGSPRMILHQMMVEHSP